jgi:hypothetical protein
MPLYSNWLLGVLNGTFSTDWDTDTIKCMLFAHAASSYITNSSGITYHAAIASGEISGTGYTASGATVSGATIAFNGFNPTKIKLDANDTSWANSTITARYAVIYKWTGNGMTSPVICWVDFGSNQSSSSGTFEIQWNASGIVEISSPDS